MYLHCVGKVVGLNVRWQRRIEKKHGKEGRFILFKSATFHALTMMRRESGLCLMVSIASEIWSIKPPL